MASVGRSVLAATAALATAGGAVAGVVRIEADGPALRLWVQGDVNPVLRRIAREDVDRFVFPEAELEDIFLSYYRGER